MKDKKEIEPLKDGSKISLSSSFKGYGDKGNHPFIAANTGMNFPSHIKPTHDVEHILDIVQNKETIEIIYRVTKDPQSDILPFDKIIKKVFGIEDGQMVFLGERDGKYVKPQPASYTFDE